MKELYFNIHNLIKIRVYYKNKRDCEDIASKYNCFQSNIINECQIELYLGADLFPIDKRTDSQEGIYVKKRRRIARWEMYVVGFDSQCAKIYYSGNRYSYRYLFIYILEAIINYYLLLRGYSLIHAAAFVYKNKAFVVNTTNYGGKTTILLKMIERGASFMSEEMTIISNKGEVLSYPLPLILHDYNLAQYQMCPIGRNKYLAQRIILNIIRRLTNNQFNPAISVNINDLFEKVKIVNEARIDKIYLIADKDNNSWDKDMCIEELVRINQYQYRYFEEIRNKYLLKNKDSEIKCYWDKMRKIIADCMAITPVEASDKIQIIQNKVSES